MIDLSYLSETWVATKLSNIADVFMGQSPPGSSYNNDAVGLPLIAGAGDLGETYPLPSKWTTAPIRVCEPGDLIYCIRATIGEMNWADRQYCIGRGVAAIRINEQVAVPTYIYFWLATLRDYVTSLGTGSTFLQIRRDDLEEISIPLPTLVEQHRIVEILNHAHGLPQLHKSVNSKFKQLYLSVFQTIFGDPVINSHAWPTLSIHEIATKISDGPFGSNLKSSHYSDEGVRVIRLQNIGVGDFINDDKVYISQEHFASLINHRCVPGDIIVGTLGEPNLRACILPDYIPEALNKADCVQVRVDPNIVTSEYICWIINHPSILQSAQKLMQGQTRTRISMGRLSELFIPIAPMELQLRFTSYVKDIGNLSQKLDRAILRESDLLNSIIARAFSGQLTALWRETRINELKVIGVERDNILGSPRETATLRHYNEGRIAQAEREEIEQSLKVNMQPLLEQLAKNFQPIGEGLRVFQQNWIDQMAALIQPIRLPTIDVQPIFSDAFRDVLLRQQEQFASIADSYRSIAANIASTVETSTRVYMNLANNIVNWLEEWPPNDHPRYNLVSSFNRQQKFILIICEQQETFFTLGAIQEKLGTSTDAVRRSLELFASLGLIVKISLSGQSSSGPTYSPAYLSIKESDETRFVDLTLLEEKA